MTEHGCKWRGLPKRSGNWHTIYTRMNRWARSGVLNRVFEQLQQQQIIRIKIEAVSLNSTSIKVHPDGTGALKKRREVHRQIQRGCTTKIHLVAADANTAITFASSRGNTHDAPAGRQLLEALGPAPQHPTYLLMDRVYEGDQTRQLALDLGYIPIVPPKANRLTSWEYNRAMCKKRNEIERLFCRLRLQAHLFKIRQT